MSEIIEQLPERVEATLKGFVDSTSSILGSDLRSVILYGSGAEGRLRPTSDVNVIVVLFRFDAQKVEQLRGPFSLAEAAINLTAMFLLNEEIEPAFAAFADKFADVQRRKRILFGDDPFDGVTVSRADSIFRLKQTLLNLVLRLREAYISRGLREEQLAALIADTAGPLRSCAAFLIELEGGGVLAPKEALERVHLDLPDSQSQKQQLSLITEARQMHRLPPGAGASAILYLIELANLMFVRVAALK